MKEIIIINGCSFNLKAIKVKNFVLAGECLGDFTNKVSAGTSNKISKCQKREIKPLYNN